ncbi:SMI1/KNR4 family protein [Streptomyces clavifer]|uniref:SMI1/KNR4 family protein n=1 Tax=Streptomyces clavifer TaxID=68188 RepID=UPI0037F7F1B4
MPPPAKSDTSLDWDRMSKTWGKDFPPDYRQFIERYGPGAIQNYLVIELPEYKDAQPASPYGGMLLETKNAEAAWNREDKSPELDGADPELITWGVDASSDLLCWDTSADDPRTWPVLVRNRDDDLWHRYDCGMVEFLARTLLGDFTECPLGDLSLWAKQSAFYLNAYEEKRLRKQGLDPWTGQPDPYTDTYDPS